MEDKGRHPYSKWIPADYSSANAANEQLGSVELFICEVCGDVLPPERTMFNHMKRHMVDGQYQCECCNYRTPQVYRLRGHAARVHPQPVGIFGGYTIKYRPKPHFQSRHVCAVCGKQFPSRAKLVRHERIHTGEKPYECSVCRRKFSQKESVKVHMVVHLKDQMPV